MHILNLVTSESAFYRQQVDILENKGIKCTTVSLPDKGTIERRSLWHYVSLYFRTLKHSLDDIDIVHANMGLTAPFALTQPHRPLVVTFWGSDLLGKTGPILKHLAPRFCEAIVMTEQMAEVLDCEANVIPSGVDTNKFSPTPQSQAQSKVGWDPGKKHILFPYPSEKKIKNFPLAKRVVNEAKTQTDCELKLHVVHGVPHKTVSMYMNAADVLLFTSKREGSPAVVKEAMACNLPVVSTDVGDVEMRLSGVKNSFVGKNESELIEYLLAVIKSGERSNGRQAAGEVSLEWMGEKIIEIYESCLER